MKLSHLLLTTSLCAVAAMPAFAQARSFSEVDQNNDGMLSESELVDAFGASGASSILLRSDMDKDGSVSIAEIQISQDDDESDDEDDDDEDDDDDENDDDEDDDEDDDDDDDDSDESDESDDD